MADNSKIEWTEATWSVATGCTRISDGCTNCYIERTPPFRMERRRFDKPGVGGTTGVKLHSDRLHWPLRWRKPRRIFVCSLADLFYEEVPDRFIADVFAVMRMADQHTFQVLTKRHARLRSLLNSEEFRGLYNAALRERAPGLSFDVWPVPNVWVGVSVENQQWADIRIPALLETPAAVRWLSCEPLLGPVNVRPYFWSGDDTGPLPGVDWVVVGGESGPRARPMHPDWARSLREQCVSAGVPFFMKQAGAVLAREWNCTDRKGHNPSEWPEPFPREYPNAA